MSEGVDVSAFGCLTLSHPHTSRPSDLKLYFPIIDVVGKVASTMKA